MTTTKVYFEVRAKVDHTNAITVALTDDLDSASTACMAMSGAAHVVQVTREIILIGPGAAPDVDDAAVADAQHATRAYPMAAI